MYERIVVPIDGSGVSRHALAPAIELADRAGAVLHLVSVVGPRGSEPPDLERLGRASGAARVETSLAFDVDPAVHLEKMAAEHPSSLFCLSTHGRGGVREVLLGSVAAHLVRTVGREVLLIGPGYDTERPFAPASMLVCVDGSPVSEAIIPVAIAWSAAFGTHLSLVQVVEPMAEHRTAVEAIPRIMTGPESYLGRVAETIGRECEVDFTVLADDRPDLAIVRHAEATGATMIAMATHGESALLRVVMGSTATSVVRRSRWPVLVIRPRLEKAVS